MAMEFNIGKQNFKRKPQKSEIGIINNQLRDSVVDLSIEQFTELVGNNGRAFTRARLEKERSKKGFKRQKLLVLDIDEGLSYNDFKERCDKYHLPYLFTYKTFSCDEELKRFRAVFMLDEWIENVEIATAVNTILWKIFPESDKSCIEVSKIFFGGKGIIEKNMGAIIKVPEFVRIVEYVIRETSKQNYRRDLRTFAAAVGVAEIKGRLGIFDEEEMGLEEFPSKIIDHGIVMVPAGASKGPETKKNKNKINVDTEPLSIHTGYDDKTLCELCPLLNDFANYKDIGHELRFLLATNLNYFQGGKKFFLSHLTKHKEKWSYDWKHTIVNYSPKKCEGSGCPYYEECASYSLYRKAAKKIQKIGKEEFWPLEQCEKELGFYLSESIDTADEGIHVIKAQTALGKTEQYCRIVRDRPDKKFLIAVPTIALQWEVAQRLKNYGVKCEITESLYSRAVQLQIPELTELLDEAFEIGCGERSIKIIRDFKKKHEEELTTEQIEKINQLLSKRKKETGEAQCLVTTHALFLMTEMYNKMPDYEIIIDEDILNTLFHQTKTISIEKLEKLLEVSCLEEERKDTIRKILNLKDEEVLEVQPYDLSEYQIAYVYLHRDTIKGPVLTFLKSSLVGMQAANKTVTFCRENHLWGCRKLIVVSATVNKELYMDYFRNQEVYFKDVHYAKYKGKLIQYSAHPLSRKFFMDNGKMDIIKNIQGKFIGDMKIISFKMLFPESEIRFGKTEGFDRYKGEDLAVIGTPHCAPIIYKLAGTMLKYNISDEIKRRRIKRNGYSYLAMTYAGSKMQNLQLFFIESELEQAIGRARLLRYDCNVYVFSNYPCQQAKLCQNPYLVLKAGSNEETKESIAELEEEVSN